MTGGGGNVELTELDGDGAATDAEKGMFDINGESIPHNLNPHPPLGFARSDPSSPVVIVGGGGNFIEPDVNVDVDASPAATAPSSRHMDLYPAFRSSSISKARLTARSAGWT